MTKEQKWVLKNMKELDKDVMWAIIECCKHLMCSGVPLYEWDGDKVIKAYGKVID